MRLTDNEARLWQECADDWKTAASALERIRLRLFLELGVIDGRAVDVLEAATNAVSGQAYMFTPQSEWLGGPSDNPSNFCYRKPYIAD